MKCQGTLISILTQLRTVGESSLSWSTANRAAPACSIDKARTLPYDIHNKDMFQVEVGRGEDR